MDDGLRAIEGAGGWVGGMPELRGRVVLVNFWTLTCINWLRQVPYVRGWARAYRDDGLVVVGVHAPEFSFERDGALVRWAVADRGIDYPVVVDDDYAVWTAFDNHFWPALYFADRDGVVRDFHVGEGRYAESERTIQRLLGVERDLTPVTGVGVEAAADWDHLRTPETYLGSRRGAAPSRSTYLDLNRWGTAGAWTVEPECVRLDGAGGSIAIHFQARDAHLVLSPAGARPIPYQVFLDGEPPGPAHGTHVGVDGRGSLDRGGLHHLVRQQGPIRERVLEIAFLEAGARAYVFTFG